MKKIILLAVFVFVFWLTSCNPDDVYISTSETITTEKTTETTTAPGITDGGVYTETETGEWEYLG